VAGTVATLYTIGQRDAVFLDPYGMAYLRRDLDLMADGLDGACRTYLRTTVALRTAVAALVGHDRLHEVHQVIGWTEYLVGALRHTELTARTALRHVLS
jgi:hypothetical protein